MENRKYFPPNIELVEIDNNISLALESTPPIGPDETYNFIEINNNNSFGTLS